MKSKEEGKKQKNKKLDWITEERHENEAEPMKRLEVQVLCQ